MLRNDFYELIDMNFKLSDYESLIYSYENNYESKRNLVGEITHVENTKTYLNSYVNVTTESVFNRFTNTIHISEKSYKPFFYYQFPIFVASNGHVRKMKEGLQ